jgi:Ca-activated chloride channel family protein
MKFAEPDLLWFLLLLPAMGWFLIVAWKRRQAAVRLFVQSRLLDSLTVGLSNGRRKARMILSLLAVLFVILALARPQWGYEWDEAKQRGLDIIVGIDASRSMLATDVKPNRLERAKLAALDLMKMAQSDRLGLIAFAGTAFLQCPLTLDEGAFRQSVSALSPDIMPQGGTALAETIAVATDAFKNEEENHKVLVMITDGEDHQEQVLEYAEEAAEAGLRIFTIGVGSPNGELIPLGKDAGKTVYLKDEQGQVVKSRLNEALLQQIAGKAKGFYLNLSGAGAIETLYTRGLAPLPKGEITARLVRVYFERFYWPLSAAIVLLLIEMFLPEKKRRRSRSKPALAALGLFFGLVCSGNATPAEAQKKFEAGEYGEAAEMYQRLREKNPEDARLAYNAGVAAYRAENFDVAQREFSSAIAAKDEKLQQSAWYNLGNTYFKVGRGESAADKKLDAWKTALKMYDQAQKVEVGAEDARKNQTVLKRMVEELEKQMEKQKQEGEDGEDKDNKDEEKKDDQDQKDGDQDKKDDQKDSKSDENKDEKKDDQQKQDSQKQDDKNSSGKEDDKPEQKPQGDPDQKKPEKEEDKQSAPKPEPADDQKKPGEDQQSMPQPQLGKLSREQAMQMLEAQKSFERPLIFRPPAEKKTDSKKAISKTW